MKVLALLSMALVALTVTAAAHGGPTREGPAQPASQIGATHAKTQATATLPPAPPARCHSRWCAKVRTARKVAIRIDRALRAYGSPMAGHGILITRAARAEGMSPFALLGIAGKESSFGKAACGSNTTGLGSCWRAWSTITLCGRRIHGPSYVSSYARGIRLTGRLIRCLLPSATTVYELHGYCASCPTWAGDVASIMRQWFRVGPELRWASAVKATR